MKGKKNSGSGRAKRQRETRLLTWAIEARLLDLAFCANCPSCLDAGHISAEQIEHRYGCTPGEASRAIAELQKRGVLGSARRSSLRGHGGRKQFLVLRFKGCNTYHAAAEVEAKRRTESLAKRPEGTWVEIRSDRFGHRSRERKTGTDRRDFSCRAS